MTGPARFTAPKGFASRVVTQSTRRGTAVQAMRDRDLRPENVPGSFAVDHTCIDCDTCRWMQPDVFGRVNGMSAVTKQPTTEEERLRAAQALISCPTHSIHLTDKQKGVVRQAAQSFPLAVPGTEGVYHMGYHSKNSFGAASYLLTRPGGNVLIDSPRFDSNLARNIKELGGAKYIFLSHKDDVADHAKWAEALSAERIIHETEATTSQGTTECEIKLEGEGPWQLPGGSSDVQLILTSGHTKGHVVLLHQPPEGNGTLFSGDHLAFRYNGQLSFNRNYNWYSLEKQLDSVAKLIKLPFLHVMPGHGRPGSFSSDADRISQMEQLLQQEGHLVAA